MGEYQYFEFRAIDQALSTAQMSELRAYSSRANITPYSFTNVYNWGDFKGDVSEWMATYFDAFIYIAGWGSRNLMFRIPDHLIDHDVVSLYLDDQTLTLQRRGEYSILSFLWNDDEGGSWDGDGESWLPALLPLRHALMDGDLRALYLGWLAGIDLYGASNDIHEPPVPANLGDLTPSLHCLADFLHLDIDLVGAAAEKSSGQGSELSEEEINRWVAQLPDGTKSALLKELISGANPHLTLELRQRIRRLKSVGKANPHKPRTAGELKEQAAIRGDLRRKRQQRQLAVERARQERARAAARKEYLAYLVGKEQEMWTEIELLVATKIGSKYDQAAALLVDLHDLAREQKEEISFTERLNHLHKTHGNRPAFLRRLEEKFGPLIQYR